MMHSQLSLQEEILDRIEEIENAKNVLSKTRNAYVTGERFEDISEDFAAFEGKQERILEGSIIW
ncbi:MAG: hypothetical protein ACLR7D_10640 [Lachnospira eligens]